MAELAVLDRRLVDAQEQLERGFFLIPAHMHEPVRRYVLLGWRPGDFFSAVLRNDFLQACGRADDENALCLTRWPILLHCYFPPGSFGSPDAFEAWITRGGVRGVPAHG